MAGELVHWFRRGDELPWVVLHGFTGAVASWHTVVDRSVAAAVVGVHLPGHHVDAPVAMSWQDNVDWVADRLRAAGISRCRLMGYSLGARVALGIVVHAPELVDQVTLIGVHPGLTTAAERDQRRRVDAEWIALLETRGIAAFVDRWEAQPIFATQSAAARAAQRRVRLAHDPMALAASLRAMGLGEMPDYRAARVDVPLRCVVGALDHKFAALAAELVDDVVAIPGCGHNVLVEDPAAVAGLL